MFLESFDQVFTSSLCDRQKATHKSPPCIVQVDSKTSQALIELSQFLLPISMSNPVYSLLVDSLCKPCIDRHPSRQFWDRVRWRSQIDGKYRMNFISPPGPINNRLQRIDTYSFAYLNFKDCHQQECRQSALIQVMSQTVQMLSGPINNQLWKTVQLVYVKE